MLAAERRSIILQKAHDEGRVIVSEMSREFNVSEETIRRDLERLEDEGHVTKTYGGAVLNDKSSIDLPFNVRRTVNVQGKQAVARLVSDIVEDGDNIILDASTTAVMICKHIKEKKRITVITNSIENMLELSDAEGFKIISTGGRLEHSSMALEGMRVTEIISDYNADKLFLSCKGIDMEKGIMDGNDEVACIKQAMLGAASKRYLTIDSSKFDRVTFSRIAGFDRIDAVITDTKPEAAWINFFEEQGIELIYPEGGFDKTI